VGSGEGWVAGRIFLPGCGYGGGEDPAVDGSAFEIVLRDLFADVVEERLDIRLQGSGGSVDMADGLMIQVRNRHDVVEAIRNSTTGSVDVQIVVELPPEDPVGPDLQARASLFLNRECSGSYPDFTADEGHIVFESMYARTDDGDYADIDRIRGRFEGLRFQDDRPERFVDGVPPWAVVDGAFEFDYTRGRPAQPFP
jgi:hypothetical protein